MRFKTGLLIGGALGYYFGAKAGRERYHQIERTLDRVRATSAYQGVAGQVADRVDTLRGRARDTASGLADGALATVLGAEPEATWEPGLEFNPDYRPTAEEIRDDLLGREPIS